MKVEKEYRFLENIDEIRIYNARKKDFYKPTPQEFDIEDIPIQEFINNLPIEIHTFIPYNDGEDFIIQSLGSFTLDRYDSTQEDAKGRLLSKLSPLFYDILHDDLLGVYTRRKPKNIRFVYYDGKKLTKLSTARIVYDMERIFIITNNVDTNINKEEDIGDKHFDEDKSNMIESFSQTGSYYNLNGKYTWSQGIYNIINRPKEEADDFYNIVFDLAIPEDQHIVDKIFNTTNKETSQCNEILRIMTRDGAIKVHEVNIYSYFDESGIIIRQGLINDITQHHHYETSKPVDFLMDGFKNSRKLALLIEPLNKKHYKFSKGFYYIIEKDYEEYEHSLKIIDNIVEKDAAERFEQLYRGEIKKIYETITFEVDANPKKKKIVDVYIERFEYNNEVHSLGFLTDITEEIREQNQLKEANELQKILIKEIHHRVKNNLQVLNSFLNLEKRAYRNDPDTIIEHMQTRLTSLALLHEKTYGSKDFKNINLKEYMKDHDEKTGNFMDSPTDIEFETYVDENLHLTIDNITPLLLIIDEITMNSIKHAFPDKSMQDKKITKKILKVDDNTACLIITDNGVGIEDTKKITKNLGCEITKQLSRNIRLIQPEKGMGYELIFPIQTEETE